MEEKIRRCGQERLLMNHNITSDTGTRVLEYCPAGFLVESVAFNEVGMLFETDVANSTWGSSLLTPWQNILAQFVVNKHTI